MKARTWIPVALAGTAAGIGVLSLSGNGGSLDVFVGSTPTATASPTTITCDQTAANAAGLTTALSAASNGQTICLTAAVSYGTFAGTSKTVTIVSQSGTGAPSPVSNSMTLSLGSGDSGFTIDGGMTTWGCGCGMTINTAVITAGSSGAHDITFKNFRGSGTGGSRYWNFDPTSSGANITIDHAYLHDYIDGEATIFIFTATSANTGMVVKNTLFEDSSTDGVKLSGSVNVTVKNNKFTGFHESLSGDGNHTDAIQFNDGSGSAVRGNVVVDADACISGYDGQDSTTITHNAVAACDSHSITLMKDNPASTISWNTVGPSIEENIICGNKTGLSGASVTNIYNNIAGGVTTSGGGTTCTPTRNDHNTSTVTQTYVHGSSASITTSWVLANFCLASGAALTGADDGGQQGVCGGNYNASTDGAVDARQ